MEHSPSTSASSEDRQPTRNESIPLKRHKKEAMTSAEKTVVVLKSKNIQNEDGPVLMANTSKVVTLYEFEITSNMSQTDITEKLTGLYPKLKGRRFYCASSTGKKAILDFDGKRRIWDGPFILRKIDGNRALYIVTDEVVTSTQTSGNGISDTGRSSGDNSSQSDNVAEQQSPPLQQPLVKIHRNRGAIEENQGNKRRTSFKGAWHCNPAASFESQSSFPSAQNITATSTFPKGDAARHLMADGGAPSVSCVGQSSVSQGGQIQFSGECTSTQSTMPESENYQSTHEAVSALDGNNPDYQYDRMDAPNLCDLKGLNVFDMDKESPFDWKDVLDVLREDSTNSYQLVSHQSTTAEVTPQFPITTSDASGGETDQGYSLAAWHCNPAASFASQSSFLLAQNVTATSTFPKGDAARHFMADRGAPSVSCVGQSSVSQEGQMQFSGECTSTQSTMLESNDYQSIYEAVSALDGNKPDYQYDPMDALNLYDLKGFDFFDMDKESRFDLKDVRDVLPEDLTTSDQLVSHQSTTTEVTPQFPITTPDASGGETDRGYSSTGGSSQGQIVQEVAACSIHDNRNSCEIPALAAAASKKPATDNLVHEGNSSQEQEVNFKAKLQVNPNCGPLKVTGRPHLNQIQNGAGRKRLAELYQARETAHSSDEGSSSKEQTFDLTINPESCRPEGGKSFSMEFNKSLPSSVTSAWAIFGPYGRVKVSRSYDEDCTLFGKKIPPGQPGTITVKITTEGGAHLGETDFTYKNPKKKLIHQGLSNKRKLDELYAAVEDLEKKVKQIQQGDNDEVNQTSSFEQGLVNQGKNLKPERILKLLIYAAAEAGATRLIETIFSLPAGKIVFEVYKDDSALPEDIAEENGHREVAVYLRGITERYSEEHCTSPDQSTIAEFDWLKLANALEDIKLKHTGPSSYKDLNQIWEDETGYSADGETSSSGSEKEISDSEDGLNKINTCEDHPYHEDGKMSLGNSTGSYCDSREKRSDLEVSKRNLCKALTTSQANEALPDQPNVQPPHGDELGSGMVSSREIQENEIYPQEDTSLLKAKKESEKEVLVCYGGNNNENFTDILTKKDKHQTWSSSFKDDDIADYAEAEVSRDDDDEKLRLPSGADVDEPGISFELNALNASSSAERSRATFSMVDKDHRHEETETTENENNEVSQKDQERYGKDDGTVFNQQLESRSLKTKKRASTETESSAQSNFLREDERKKGQSNSEASNNDKESESTSDLNGGESMQSIEEDKAISGTILNQAENTASRYKLNNNVTQKEKDMTERTQEDESKVLNQELSSVIKSNDKRMKAAFKVTRDSAENTTRSNNEMEEWICSSKGEESNTELNLRPSRSFGLPNKVPKFVGRTNVCEEISMLLTHPETTLVSLISPPGFGKTAVAITIGHEMLEKGKDVLYVSLRTVDSVEGAAKRLLEVIGIPVVKDPVSQVKSFLSLLKKETLLVLDNAEDLQNASKSACDQFLEEVGQHGKNLVILITSRNPLPVFEFPFFRRDIPLKPLDEEASVFFLKHYAPNISDQLARHFAKPKACGGVPLFLKLTASFLESKTNDPVNLHRWLRNCPHSFLNAEDPNIQDFFTLFKVFYSNLRPEVQKGLSWLAAFPSVFTKMEAKNVLFRKDDYLDFQILLNSLVSHSLIQKEEVDYHLQYSLHPLVQAFCIACREDECKGYNIAIKLFSCHYLALLQQLNDDFMTNNCKVAIDKYEMNKGNIAHALSASTEDEILKCYGINVSTETVTFLAKVMHQDEFMSTYDKFLEVAETLPDKTLYSECLVSIGFKQLCYYSYKDAYRTNAKLNLQKAHDLQIDLGIYDTECLGHCKSMLGLCTFLAGDRKEGMSLIAQGIGVRRKLLRSKHSGKWERILLAGGLFDLGMALFSSGQLRAALNIWENICLVKYRELLGTHPFTASLLDHIGNIYQALGKPLRAVALKKESLRINTLLLGDFNLDTARAYYGLGCALKESGATHEALKNLMKAREIQYRVIASRGDIERTEQEITSLLGSARTEPAELYLETSSNVLSHESTANKHLLVT